MKFDYAVIGAGASGMSAAVILAKHGYSVALIEAARTVGPLLRGFERKGIYYDTGFHYTGGLRKDGVLDIFFRYLGIMEHIEPIPFDPEGFDLIRFSAPDRDFLFPYGYGRIRDRLLKAFPKERAAVDAYLGAVKESFQSRPYLNLEKEFSPLQELRSVHGPSLKDVLDRLSPDAALKRILSAHCYLHGAAPGDVTFAQHAAVVGSYYESVHGLRGGGARLVHAFEKTLFDHGVTVFCGRHVSGIDLSFQGNPESVRLANGEQISCKACIVSIHPRRMLELLPSDRFRPSYVRRLEGLDETFSAFILYGKSRSLNQRLKGKNIFSFFSPAENGFREKGPLHRRPLFISSAVPKNSASTEPGFIAICPATLGQAGAWLHSRPGRRPGGYRIFKARVMEMLKDRVQESCPDISEGIEIVEGATPLTLRDFSHSPAGSLYGAKHRVGQYNPVSLTRIDGLYLAGQAVVAPGVLGAVLSAFLACGNILGHDRLRKELNACR